MKLYIISGLAADERVFNYIKFPSGYEPVHLPWLTPMTGESLQHYALRMAESIDKEKPFAILGLSMGGMIATEIANAFGATTTILFSSVPVAAQLPRRYRIAQALGLYKLVPVRMLKSASIAKRIFSTDKQEHKKILRQVVKDSDPHFIRWAIPAILKWENKTIPNNLFHIHGSADEILPIKNTQPSHVIKNGKHLMVMTRANELNEILKEILTCR